MIGRCIRLIVRQKVVQRPGIQEKFAGHLLQDSKTDEERQVRQEIEIL